MFKKGQKVKFIGSSRTLESYRNDPCPPFIVDTVHEVDEVEIGDWRTRISLVGQKGKFNSVSFEPVD